MIQALKQQELNGKGASRLLFRINDLRTDPRGSTAVLFCRRIGFASQLGDRNAVESG